METGWFYVNIADPPQIVVVEGANPSHVARTFVVSAAGPHGLDLDIAARRLFCACDDKTLVVLDCRSGAELTRAPLAGAPDVIFFNRERRHLYMATGEPGLIEVFETDRMRLVQTVRTGSGAHTLGFDERRNIEEGNNIGHLTIGERSAQLQARHTRTAAGRVETDPSWKYRGGSWPHSAGSGP